MYVCIFTDCNADVNTVYQQSNTVNRQTVTVQQLAATKAPVRAATGVRVLPVSLPATTHIRHFLLRAAAERQKSRPLTNTNIAL